MQMLKPITSIRALLSVFALLVTGCSTTDPYGSPIKITDVRTVAPAMAAVEIELDRARFLQVLGNEGLTNRVRPVQVWNSAMPGSGDVIREYRLFGIDPHSVYAMMGLENADVLVAANDYIFFNPQRFRDFVKVMGYEKQATVEIRRGGKSILFKYTFKESASS